MNNIDVGKISFIEQKLRELLVEYAIVDMPPEEIDLNEKIHATFVNSILFIKIVVALETEFEFEFADEDLDVEKYTTLNDIVKYVYNVIGKKRK